MPPSAAIVARRSCGAQVGERPLARWGRVNGLRNGGGLLSRQPLTHLEHFLQPRQLVCRFLRHRLVRLGVMGRALSIRGGRHH